MAFRLLPSSGLIWASLMCLAVAYSDTSDAPLDIFSMWKLQAKPPTPKCLLPPQVISLGPTEWSTANYNNNEFLKEKLRPQLWSPDVPFLADVIKKGYPALLRGTVVDTWPARNWTWEKLADMLEFETLDGARVNSTDSEQVYWSPDDDAKLNSLLPVSAPYQTRNLSAPEALRGIHTTNLTRMFSFLNDVPTPLQADVPQEGMYLTEKDAEMRQQLLWLSTGGVRTHTHCDSDFNAFVQLLGRKRFTLWPPTEQSRMCLFPRSHSLWQKSQVDYARPDLGRCPGYAAAASVTVEVGPGDLLYVPPYWFHHVETLTPSVSLTTLSRWKEAYDRMFSVYFVVLTAEKLGQHSSRMYALRMFLYKATRDSLGLSSSAEVEQFMHNLLQTRYRGLESHFDVDPARDTDMCVHPSNGKTPMNRYMLEEITVDAGLVAEHYRKLPDGVRELLFTDYVEKVLESVAGVDKTVSFLRYCWRGQGFFYHVDPPIVDLPLDGNGNTLQLPPASQCIWDYAPDGGVTTEWWETPRSGYVCRDPGSSE